MPGLLSSLLKLFGSLADPRSLIALAASTTLTAGVAAPMATQAIEARQSEAPAAVADPAPDPGEGAAREVGVPPDTTTGAQATTQSTSSSSSSTTATEASTTTSPTSTSTSTSTVLAPAVTTTTASIPSTTTTDAPTTTDASTTTQATTTTAAPTTTEATTTTTEATTTTSPSTTTTTTTTTTTSPSTTTTTTTTTTSTTTTAPTTTSTTTTAPTSTTSTTTTTSSTTTSTTTTTTAPPTGADLGLAAGTSTHLGGRIMLVTIDVTNQGDAPTAATVVFDIAGGAFVTSNPEAGWACSTNAQVVTCVGSLAADETDTIDIQLSVPASPGTAVVDASVTGPDDNGPLDDNDLQLLVTVPS